MVRSNRSKQELPKKKMSSAIIKSKTQKELKKKITHVFSRLRREASMQSRCSDDSAINLDESSINTATDKNLSQPIVITDDEPNTMVTSTPIKIRSTTVDEMILSASKQMLEDSNNNQTKIINEGLYKTVDLTGNSNTVDLTNETQDHDCYVTSVSQGSSMSGDSEVTVLQRPARRKSFTASQLLNAIKNLDTGNKDKILACMAEQLLMKNKQQLPPRALETAEDTYIKEVIVAKSISRNSIGSNVYNPDRYVNQSGLRMIVVDGSNVAMAHGDNKVFSVRGLRIVVDYFLNRGHVVKAFVPRFRNKAGKSSDPMMLIQMERQGQVIFTPSREVRGRLMVSYDDRYIIQCAAEFQGIVVSNDKFSDLIPENPRWEPVISNQVLPFTWCNGMIMFPRDPLGRNGPPLEQFLKMPVKQRQWKNKS